MRVAAQDLLVRSNGQPQCAAAEVDVAQVVAGVEMTRCHGQGRLVRLAGGRIATNPRIDRTQFVIPVRIIGIEHHGRLVSQQLLVLLLQRVEIVEQLAAAHDLAAPQQRLAQVIVHFLAVRVRF